MSQEEKFLSFLIENMVDSIEAISIEKKDDELGTLLSLKVHESDMGTIIGKKGATVNALRTILRLYGMKVGKKITLKVIE